MVEVFGTELLEEVAGSVLVVVCLMLVVVEVFGTELVDEVVGSVLVVVSIMLVVVDVVGARLVDEVVGSVLVGIELVETSLVVVVPVSGYFTMLEKPLCTSALYALTAK